VDDQQLIDEWLRNLIAAKRAAGADAARAEAEARAELERKIRNDSGNFTDAERKKWIEEKRDESIARGDDPKRAASDAEKAFAEMVRTARSEAKARQDFVDQLRKDHDKAREDQSLSKAQKVGQKIAQKALWNGFGQKILKLGWDSLWDKGETFTLKPLLEALPGRLAEVTAKQVVPDIVADLKSKAPYEIHGRDFELFVSRSVEGSFQYRPALESLKLGADGDKALEKLGMVLVDTPAKEPAKIPLFYQLGDEENPRFKWSHSFGGSANLDWSELAKGHLPKALKSAEGSAEIKAKFDAELHQLEAKASLEGSLGGKLDIDLKPPPGEKGSSYRFLVEPKFYERHAALEPEARLSGRFEAESVTLSLNGTVKTTINREALEHHLKYEWNVNLEAEFHLGGSDERRARREQLLDKDRPR
jgi:hypothetical protein